jgi:hypothetical protein
MPLLVFLVACNGMEVLDLGGDAGGSGSTSSSSGSGAPNCKSFTACGGNVVGTWSVADECVAGWYNFASACPSSTFGESVSIGGTIVFNANGTYTTSPPGGVGADTVTIDRLCLASDAGPTVTCDQLQASFNTQSMQVDGGSSTMATCTTTSSGCSCQLPGTQGTISENGTYSTSGTSLTLTAASGSATTVPYCVQGNGLLIQTQPAIAGAPNPITVAATKWK